MSALIIDRLKRDFGAKAVLKDVCLEARHGELTALWGANGSGKTTLLRILATLVEPTAGDAFVYGHSVKREPEAVRRLIGWSPATEAGFFARLTGRENLEAFAAFQGLPTKPFQDLIARWGRVPVFEEALATPFYQCSTGMRQLLHLCRAFFNDPLAVFLDEPTRALDPETAALARVLLQEAAEGRTVVFSTHSRDDAAALASRQFTLRGGEIEC